MSERTYAIIGGSSGIGFALAQALVARGDRVRIGARSPGKLEAAIERLGSGAIGRTVDTTDRASIAEFFAAGQQQLSGPFISAASYRTGAFRNGDPETSEALFAAKFWSQHWTVFEALPYLRTDAGVVLMSGAASARPIGGGRGRPPRPARPPMRRATRQSKDWHEGWRSNSRRSGSIASHRVRPTANSGVTGPKSSARAPTISGAGFASSSDRRMSWNRRMPRCSSSTTAT